MRQSRYLVESIEQLCFSDHKIAFVSGPRQCGKTTFAKQLLQRRSVHRYYNWDQDEFRKLWAHRSHTTIPPRDKRLRQAPMVVFDEIHKAKLWKRTLKGIYDTLPYPVDILVTGSARLTTYRKGGDSLLGRYFPFRLHPFSVGELSYSKPPTPELSLQAVVEQSASSRKETNKLFESLLRYGPFPEPFLAQDEKKARLWKQTRVEILVREDIRDLSRIPELSRLEMLVALLPERVGSLFSLTALREDLEVSYDTVKRWVSLLKELYYLFEVKPYHRRISRSLKKEGKIYLWDYSEVRDPGARYENLVAAHLLKACHYWTDTGEGKFELHYLRNKEKQEVDFLIARDGEPWLAIEAKLADTQPSPHLVKFMRELGCSLGLQLVRTPNVYAQHRIKNQSIVVASASTILKAWV